MLVTILLYGAVGGMLVLAFVCICVAAACCIGIGLNAFLSLTPDAAGLELDDWQLDEWEQEFTCTEPAERPTIRELAWLQSTGVQW